MGSFLKWKLGYNTNGFQSHRLKDALWIIKEIGYQSVALTLDHCHLDPLFATQKEIQEVADFFSHYGLDCYIETGGRYLLDPWKKHYPSLVSEGWQRRIEVLKKSIEIGSQLKAKGITIFSGKSFSQEEVPLLYDRLIQGIEILLREVEGTGMTLALEPEPGMVVECLTDYLYVKELGGFQDLKLTMDLGHVWCIEKIPISQALHGYASEIMHLHIEDIKGKEHVHLPFGRGDMPFESIFKTLNKIGPAFPIHVELSRSSHEAPKVAKEAYEFLTSHLK